MEDERLATRVRGSLKDLSNYIDELIAEVEEVEAQRDAQKDRADTLDGALAQATDFISQLQKQINDREG